MSVATYTVHEPADAGPDRVDRADELQFVKDGFSWITAVFPPLGFVLKSLWLPAIAYIAVVSVIASALSAIGIDDTWTSILVMAVNLYLGFEASTIQRWMLDRSGWNMIGSVSGKTLEECERRFFESWLPGQPMVNIAAKSSAAAHSAGGFRRFVTRS